MGKAWWWDTCTLTHTQHRPSAQTHPRQNNASALHVRLHAASTIIQLPKTYIAAESGYWETHLGQLLHVRLQGQLSLKISASKRQLLHSDDTTDHAQGVFEHLASKGVPRPDLTGLQVLVEGRVPLGEDRCWPFCCNANSVAPTIKFESNSDLDSLCTSLWWLQTPDSWSALQRISECPVSDLQMLGQV